VTGIRESAMTSRTRALELDAALVTSQWGINASETIRLARTNADDVGTVEIDPVRVEARRAVNSQLIEQAARACDERQSDDEGDTHPVLLVDRPR
jgi:hypothetical protein